MQVQNIDNRHELLHSGLVDAHRPPINQTCMGQCFKIYCTAFKAAVCKAALGCACITSQFTIWPLNVIGLQARNWSLRKKNQQHDRYKGYDFNVTQLQLGIGCVLPGRPK